MTAGLIALQSLSALSEARVAQPNLMETQIAPEAIAAIATIIAALLAGSFSFVNLTMSKEMKTSEFRQAWIDGLREDLAKFFSAARAFARSSEAARFYGKDYEETTLLPISAQKLGDLRHEAADSYYRIMLRLNPDEPEHIELQRLIDIAISEQNQMLSEEHDNAATISAIEAAAKYSQPVLKAEWRRVKKGELLFRVVRNWIAPALVGLCIAGVALLWTGILSI